MEKQVTRLLNRLAEDVDILETQSQTRGNEFRIKKLEHVLEQILEQLPVDEEMAMSVAMELVAERYEALGNSEYETERLKHVFSTTEEMKQLDEGILSDVVSQIYVDRKGSVQILLKNGQILE